MLERKPALMKRKEELEKLLVDPTIQSDSVALHRISLAYREVERILEKLERLEKIQERFRQTLELRADADNEIRELVQDELAALSQEEESLLKEIKALLIEKDPNDEKSVIMEIRAAAGGEEAALFAADLFRMYASYAEKKGWPVEVLSSNPTDLGGFKEIIFEIKGKGAYSRLKFEGGAHRVQRVPATESSGRLHTSTVTVAVMPEAEEVDVSVNPEDLRIDVFRASGHGGQCVQKTDSAVRITHLPSGLVVTCQDERSQLKNKERALRILRSRLLEIAQAERANERTTTRRLQVKRGERSEKIRTYNFPQNRLTDHRVDLDLYNLPSILEGELDEIFDALESKDIEERLEAEASR